MERVALPIPFRERVDLAARVDIGAKARERHPDHVPAILERGGVDAPPIARQRYLLPATLTGGQLQYVVRRRLRMQKEDALFLFCGERLVPPSATARELHARHKDPDDGLLYVRYALEHTFG